MKKILYILTALVLALTLASCESFLNKEPISDLGANLFWQNATDVSSAQAAMYASFATTMSVNFYDWGEVRGDNYAGFQSGPIKKEELMSDDIPDDNGACSWTELYRTINRANLIIKNVPLISPAPSNATAALAEAYAMRALCYFYAVRVWGDVPLFLDAVEQYDESCLKERTDKAQILTEILNDLHTAQGLFAAPSSSIDRVYLNLGAAYAIEMDVYAWMHDYAQALSIYENKVAALPVSAFAFKEFTPTAVDQESSMAWRGITMDGSSDKEVYFAVRYDKAVDGTENGWRLLFGYSGEQLQVKPETLEDFEEGDIRRAGTFNETATSSYVYMEKFRGWEQSANEGYSENDYIMYRVSDILLLYAEALVQQNRIADAMAVVNKIRTRANLSALPASLSKNEAADAVLKERRMELFGEGKYWFDLVRTGNAQKLAGCPDSKILFPIHRDHLLQNKKLTQN